MPRRDWISRYPRVAVLLQQDGDVLEGVSREQDVSELEAVPASCAICRGAPVYPADATVYVQHCIDTGHLLRQGQHQVLDGISLTLGRAARIMALGTTLVYGHRTVHGPRGLGMLPTIQETALAP